MSKIAVCDDEQSYLHNVKRLLDEYGAAHDIEPASHKRCRNQIKSDISAGLIFLLTSCIGHVRTNDVK